MVYEKNNKLLFSLLLCTEKNLANRVRYQDYDSAHIMAKALSDVFV